MAMREQREVYSHAMIDCSDMTLTEYDSDNIRTYSLMEILKRWAGIPDIKIEIRREYTLPEEKG